MVFIGFTWIMFALTSSRVLPLNMKIVSFKTLSKNTQIRYFWAQILSFLVLHETLHIDKFEIADFIYDYGFLKLLLNTGKYVTPLLRDF